MMYEQKTADEVCTALAVRPADGLSGAQAKENFSRYGANEFTAKKPKTKLSMFLSQLNDPMIYILFVAAAISLFLREVGDAVIILAVVLLNAIIGMTQEAKAEAALAALKQMTSPTALVRRDGKLSDIPARELVPGDIVILDAGRVVPADLRLITAVNLKIDESALTGESVPSEKDAVFVADQKTGIGDRLNMAYSSTNVTYGRGEGVVAATGMDTEIGRIAAMLGNEKEELTPLQKRLADLGKMLGILAVVICAVMFGIAVLQQRDIAEMLLTAISLAVAAIPEGLPAVVTIVLALGVSRMVKVNTIVRRLPSVETLGAVSVVCSDKTGTLTQNRMTVERVNVHGQSKAVSALSPEQDRLFLTGFVLCNDASILNDGRVGDPTELALLDMGAPSGFSREGLEQAYPRINEQAFDSERKLMTTVHKAPDGRVVAFTKGAMDILLARCTHIMDGTDPRVLTGEDKSAIEQASSLMARDALRVLALAVKFDDDSAAEQGLAFVGLTGMIDPPRPEAKEAVQKFKDAHIRTVMITGDHRDTALAIARELGIAEDENQCATGAQLDEMTQEELNARVDNLRVFARVSPEHKVMIVKALKSHGYIVSMTGDGVNDAPSLKAADIGVAMGITGTDVAKGAADMVLTDDNFATIELAVEEGRGIYANIKKTVLFLLSANFGEIISMFTAIAIGLAAPLRAIHILWVNLITDTLPALALGVDSKDKDIMKAPPRSPSESLFAHGGFALTLFYGFVIAAITLGAFLFLPIRTLLVQNAAVTFDAVKQLLLDPAVLTHAQTYAFVTLGVSQLFHAIGMRNTDRSVFAINHLENRLMVVAFFTGLALQVAVTEIPFLTDLFGTVALTFGEWLVLVLLSAIPLLVHELVALGKFLYRKAAAR